MDMSATPQRLDISPEDNRAFFVCVVFFFCFLFFKVSPGLVRVVEPLSSIRCNQVKIINDCRIFFFVFFLSDRDFYFLMNDPAGCVGPDSP